MSDFRAIGGVSATLKELLRTRMELPGDVTASDFHVTVSTPQAEPPEAATLDAPRVNLFLYQVTESASLKNQEIPGHGHPGTYGRPPLSLDLHYLLTAYGSTEEEEDLVNETRAHFLMGSAMRVLHNNPLLTGTLLHSSLVGEFERVRLSLEPLSLEDLTKIWTALTLPYRLSAAYKATVVQIESQHARRFALPVGEPPEAGPRVTVLPLRRPQVDEIRVRRPGDPPERERPFPYARIGDTLILRGSNFGGEPPRVLLGPVDATAQVVDRRDDRLELTVPDDPELQPGPQAVRVVRDVLMGEPPAPHTGFQSNLSVFVVVPTVTAVDPASGPDDTTLTVEGERLFQEGRVSLVLVGDAVFRAANPEPPALAIQTPTEIQVAVTGLDPGTYRVRVRVNGAESLEESITFEVTP
jgi:hypothetical protein